MITGLFGGMGGCAMIGQSVINVKSGAETVDCLHFSGYCTYIYDYLYLEDL